jgi:predicted extracellular nuclease
MSNASGVTPAIYEGDSMNVKKVLLIAGGSVFALGVIGSFAGQSQTKSNQKGTVVTTQPAAPNVTATTAAPATTTTKAPTTTTTEAPTTTTTARTPTWTKVTTLSGTGNKNGPTFTLQGGQQRLRWSVVGYRPDVDPAVVSVSFYIQPSSDAPSEQNGPGSDSASLYENAGSYHIEVLDANANWTVTLEELR